MKSPSDLRAASGELSRLVGVALAYFVTGWLGLLFGNLAGTVTMFWPPSGIALAAYVVFGRRALVPIAIGAFAVNLVATGRLPLACTIALGNTCASALAGELFLHRAEGRRSLARTRDALALVIAGGLGAVVAGVVGSVGTYVLGEGHPIGVGTLYVTWWLGDMTGVLLVAPPILSLATELPFDARAGRRGLSTGATLASVLLALAPFVLRFPDPPIALPLVLLQIVAIVACCLRFGTRGAHLSALVVAVGVIVGTVLGRGPFAVEVLEHAQALLWSGLALDGAASLFVSSLVAEWSGTESRLMRSEERLRAMFDNAPNGMLLLDARRNVVLANPAALQMAGRNHFDEGDSWRLLNDEGSMQLREALRRGAERGERIVESRMSQQTPEGKLREFVVRATILGTWRQFEGAVVLVEDVTEREAERRDREDMERQLAAAQRLESIGNLAGGIAHDFNNMLQAIRANLELAELFAQRGKDQSQMIERALSAADRASALTRQLLSFSRRQPASFGRVDVVATLRSALALLERLLPEDIHLVFDPRVSEAYVRGDHAQLEQVVLNLVVNARDAMPQGGALRIELSTERFGEAGALVLLNVTDQGPGVAADIRDRIFEPFFTTKPTGRGTGLGLAVVYGIVKSHGGAVHVENAPSGGACFCVELPMLDEPYAVPDASEPEGPPPEGQGERVLLVEDDAMVRVAVRDMLANAGYEVSIASNGADAVALYEDAGGAFDVVILDVVMPVMGGREAYERLRRIDPQVGVIFATGYSEEQIDVGFVLRERVPVITKPYERSALLSVMTQVLVARGIRMIG